MNEIMVSIVCDVFNHEHYLRQCLDGIVMQQTNFAFEILIHDDASTDKSVEIIKEYVDKYPHLFKPIYQKENKFSKGISIWKDIQFPRAKGKYIAICEGDDYWTDPLKLQKQVDFLEANPAYGLIHTKVYHQIDSNIHEDHIYREKSSFKELIFGQKISTLSVLVSRKVLHSAYQILDSNKKLQSTYMGDYPLFLVISSISDIAFLNTHTGVYRIIANSASRPSDIKRKYQFDLEVIRIKQTYYKYAKTCKRDFCNFIYSIRFRSNLFHSYKRIVKSYGIIEMRVLNRIILLFPFALVDKLLNLNKRH